MKKLESLKEHKFQLLDSFEMIEIQGGAWGWYLDSYTCTDNGTLVIMARDHIFGETEYSQHRDV